MILKRDLVLPLQICMMSIKPDPVLPIHMYIRLVKAGPSTCHGNVYDVNQAFL